MKETRPTGTTNGTNFKRYHLYKDVFEHLTHAMENGFYIEAIALLESAISDRLESVANIISKGTDYSYKTIGQLVDYLRGIKQENALIQYFSYHRNYHYLLKEFNNSLKKIWEWKDCRNKALHGMCKLYSADNADFCTRYAVLEEVAKEGINLFCEVSNTIKKAQNAYKRQQKSLSNQQAI